MMILKKMFLLVILSITLIEGEAICGYKSCNQPKEGYTNIHLIPHTHNDVGWLKTVDQYYYGQDQGAFNAGVQYIWNSVIQSLVKDKNRKFIYGQTAYFWKWWNEQNEDTKKIVKELVENGQLEFVGGGWSMNDEAVSNYQAVIDQMSWGLRRLNDTFGACGRPKVAWQIDNYGHSKEIANIFAALGFDAFIMVRIDSQIKLQMKQGKEMEFIWRGSNSIGPTSDIFSVVLNQYTAPEDFCFEPISCDIDPIVTDPNSPEYNAQDKVEELIRYATMIQEYYNTSNVFIPMGQSFSYQYADMWFTNIDKIISFANAMQVTGSKYNFFYSTPSCYVKAVYDETKGVLNSTMKEDDFFPYSDGSSSYSTGLYTSRPNLKRFERSANNFLQVCKQLTTLSNISSNEEKSLTNLREAMGVLQHHNAIAGTEKQYVALDFARILQKGVAACEKVSSLALSNLLQQNTSDSKTLTLQFDTCALTNISQCHLTETTESFVVTVYNPLSRPVTKYVRLPVLGTAYSVKDPKGNEVPIDLFPIFKPILTLTGRKSNATIELMFAAGDVPPVGYSSFYVTAINGNKVISKNTNPEFTFTTNKLGIEIDPDTGLISTITRDNKSYPITQNFWYYNGMGGGAYLFEPTSDAILFSENVTFEVYQGDLITEVRQIFAENLYQSIRLYQNEQFVEFDWLIGGPDNNDTLIGAKQITTRFQTNLNSSGNFYTDANGRQMMQRTRRFENSTNSIERIAANYRPVTSRIFLRDEEQDLEFGILTDRSQGGTSLRDGELEVLIYRNQQSASISGIGENLIGTDFAYRGSHFVVFGFTNSSDSEGQSIAALERDIAHRKQLDSWIFLSPMENSTFDEYRSSYTMTYSALKEALPKNVNILTIEPWKESSILLRLEHIFDKDEDPKFSESAIIKIKTLFSTFEVTNVEETTLGANQFLKENQRLNFTTTNQPIFKKEFEDLHYNILNDDFTITLKPSQIRTFIIYLGI